MNWLGGSGATVLLLLLAVHTAQSETVPPKGHLQHLGAHRDPLGSISELDHVPSPKEFWDGYVSKSRPLVMRGVAKNMPAFSQWTDEFLREHYGLEKVFVEQGKLEDRGMDTDTLTFADFLDRYREEDMYLVQNLPMSMMGDVHLLPCLGCGGFLERVQEAIAWYSSGGTSSVLHNDEYENINCLFAGTKKLLMFDRSLQPIMESPAQNWRAEGAYSPMNVSKVDMIEFPLTQEMDYYVADMQPGDCLYIPYLWYHQIRSFDRNIAVNVWWAPEQPSFDETDCDGFNVDAVVPLSDVEFPEVAEEEEDLEEVVPGADAEPLDIDESVDELLDQIDENPLTLVKFFEWVDNALGAVPDAVVEKWFAELDVDGNEEVDAEEADVLTEDGSLIADFVHQMDLLEGLGAGYHEEL